jgi:hypothetical protein
VLQKVQVGDAIVCEFCGVSEVARQHSAEWRTKVREMVAAMEVRVHIKRARLFPPNAEPEPSPLHPLSLGASQQAPQDATQSACAPALDVPAAARPDMVPAACCHSGHCLVEGSNTLCVVTTSQVETLIVMYQSGRSASPLRVQGQ